jgi:putative Ig domain-containing protein
LVILAPAATVIAAALGATVAATPASARPYPPPSIHLLCTAANGGTLEGSVCALPPGMTTAPNNYSAAIAASRAGAAGAAGATVAFALTAGSLPPGLTLAPSSGSSTVITGSPTKAGTFTFTIKATDGGLTATLAYEITVTVQGPPDQLLCAPSANGGFLENGVCELPDAVTGAAPYTWSLASGTLPPGLALQTFSDPRDASDELAGTPTTAGTYTFTMRLTDYAGQQAAQRFTLVIDR